MKLQTLMMSAAAAALFAGASTAQTEPETDAPVVEEQSEAAGAATMDTTATANAEVAEPEFASIEDMTVGDVVGTAVYDPEDNRIGEVDYVIAGDGGEPQAVIGIGGFLGLGEYTVALPVSEFALIEQPFGFRLDTDKETLKQQPEFDESGVESLPDDMLMSELMVASSDSMNTDAGADASSDADVVIEGDAEATATDAPEASVEPLEEGTVEDATGDELQNETTSGGSTIELESDADATAEGGADMEAGGASEMETEMNGGADSEMEMEMESGSEMNSEMEMESDAGMDGQDGMDNGAETETDAEAGAEVETEDSGEAEIIIEQDGEASGESSNQ